MRPSTASTTPGKAPMPRGRAVELPSAMIGDDDPVNAVIERALRFATG